MKKALPLFVLLTVVSAISQAQLTRYVIRFKNKGGTPYSFSNPLAYLSQKAIDRRTRYAIAIDSTDLPVTPSYITQVRNVANVNFLNVSRWLNAITIQTSDANAINTINAFPFVKSVTGVASRPADGGRGAETKFAQEVNGDELPLQTGQRIEADYFNYGTGSYNEIHLHNGEFLHNIGLRGQNMQIAMLDNGYNNYTNLRSFDSMNLNGQVLGTWDFVAREANVSNDGSHGMNCLSIIVANVPGQFIGKAPKASFWLYQTEDNASEYPIEEFNWACGAERADSSGADVISSSLGYGLLFSGGLPDYPYSWLDGNTLMAAIAADLAAKKGILPFIAAGNEGNGYWRFIISPADADSAIAVGAVSASGAVASFSSYGPSGDGQIKPDMASVGSGTIIQNTNNTIGTGSGTSFACPSMAGLGTCLWQGFPEFNNMKILKTLQQAGHKASNPDDRVGYGIPNVKLAFSRLLTEYATSSSSVNGCRVTVNWNSKDVSAMKYEIERKAPGEPNYTMVGFVPAQAGSILANRTYQFDNDLTSGSSGTYSYRIRQVIDTAAAGFTAVYIDTTNITISSPCVVTGTINPTQPGTYISVNPNPVDGSKILLVVETLNAITNMPISVYDAKGSLMLQVRSSKGTGKKTIELPAGKLAKGKYYIKVLDGTKVLGTTEFIKL
ncbi:MAG TPA: S8 family serine peptidase [Chitinophagaceae bacterium]|nr:S8 family serine peptidase [Chitinophagaceae bacterium]